MLGGPPPPKRGRMRRRANKPFKRITPALMGLAVCLGLCLMTAPSQAKDQRPAWLDRAVQTAAQEGYAIISLKELRAVLAQKGSAVILDVRPDYEYAAGHLPGAVNLEFHLGHRTKLPPDRAAKLAAILGPDKMRQVVIYCRSHQ